jgi:catechol 2,3-dioxygenase-like lactoylglutathione lyase family enzyme
MHMNTPSEPRPGRLHHHAYVSRDLEATRRFYEDIMALPLVATWCEQNDAGSYCHTFFELGDGGCLAFFQFADAAFNESQARLASASPFDHIAFTATKQVAEAAMARAAAAGVVARRIDHGYCVSYYLRDPDGLVVELTVDDPHARAEAPERRASAHADLARWLGGDHTPNNTLRAHGDHS